MAEQTYEEKQYVVFQLGAETFGLEINKVKEIIVYQESTRMPGSSNLIEGIINLRGHVIPIFNLKRKFGFPEVENTGGTRIIVVEAKENTVGIIVDKVNEVVMISGELIEKPSSLITTGVDEDFITGVAKMESGLVILLELEKVVVVELSNAV